MSKKADPLSSVRISPPKQAESDTEPTSTESVSAAVADNDPPEDEVETNDEQAELERRQALRDEKATVTVQPPVVPMQPKIWIAQESREITVKGSLVLLYPGREIFEERWGEEFVRGLRTAGVRMKLKE